MKLKKIVANDIKKCHPSQNSYPTDFYYQQLANRLQEVFSFIDDTDIDNPAEVKHCAAIMLANYMEDIVSDSGQWRAFSNLCMELYGFPVPMFHQEEEYFADEPSLNAIRFLVWCVGNDVSDSLVLPDSLFLEELSVTAYHILGEAFEEAPVNEQLADDIMDEIQHAAEGFDQLRAALKWIYAECYLVVGERNEMLVNKHIDEVLALPEEDGPEVSPDMALYYAFTRCIFKYEIGPLALYPKDYLAAVMRAKGMEREAEEVSSIEMLDTGTYKYERIRHTIGLGRLKVTRTNGRQLELEAWELNLPEEDLKRFDGFMSSSLIYYQGEWHVNGLLFPLPKVARHWKGLCKDDPDNMKPGICTLISEMLLDRTSGQQIAYFADKEALKDFMEKKIRFPRHLLSFADEQEGELPTLFVDKEEPQNCLQIFYDYSPCIADPNNPFYDKDTACEEAIDLLWDAESVTTHAVSYLLDHDFLPDIYDNEILSTFSTPEQKRRDIDFLMRFFRREDY